MACISALALAACKKPKPVGSGSASASGAGSASGAKASKSPLKLPPGFKDRLGQSTPEPKINGPAGIAPGSAIAPYSVPAPPKANAQAAALMKIAQQAHYDAADLGLRALAFKVHVTETKTGHTGTHTVVVQGRGAWKKGDKAPLIAVDAVARDGKPVPRKTDIQRTIYTSSRYRTRRLLMGLGESYLRARLRAFAGKDGKVSAAAQPKKAKAGSGSGSGDVAGALTILYHGSEFGENTVTLAKDYRIVAITNRSPVGVTRTMTYRYTTKGGRYLVTAARLGVVLAPDAKVPPKVSTLMQGSNGMTLSFEYKKVGRFELPVHIVKDMPGLKSKTVIELTYTGVE